MELDIQNKGYACSTIKGNKMFIGCKDGTLIEMNCRTFKLDREMENEMPIQSITVLDDNLLLLAHSV